METDSAIAKSENQKRVTQDSQRTADHSLQAMSPELPLRSRPGRWTLLSQTLARRRSSRGGLRSWQEVITTFNPLGPLGREQREEPKSDDALPKRAIGSVHLEFKRCGRPNCRCRFGLFHGPYVYRHWREGGRQRKEYVQMDRLSDVLLDMERQRADAARPAEVRRALKEVRHAYVRADQGS
jgi:hypothetical protein